MIVRAKELWGLLIKTIFTLRQEQYYKSSWFSKHQFDFKSFGSFYLENLINEVTNQYGNSDLRTLLELSNDKKTMVGVGVECFFSTISGCSTPETSR